MNYTPLTNLKNAWIFRHKSLPITTKESEAIKPMTAARAKTIWDNLISDQVDHPDFFKQGDWPHNKSHWHDFGKWEGIWESSATDLPESITAHLAWEANTVIYYCSSREQVIETTWKVFQRCWKNFLFMNDGVILIGKKRQETVQFLANGQFKIGQRVNK
jgi:hypothetical protein